MTAAITPEDGAVVVLESVWWKNPFLWMALGIGIPSTSMMMEDGVEHLAPGSGVATLVLAVLAHLSLRARLEIRPDGFREKLAFWRTIEHRWAHVGGFSIFKQDEAEDAVAFWVLENGRNTGKFDILMGAYGENVKALTDRMNAARAKALGAAAT
ncbi:MAG TPA: hypothetical protein VF584_24045 [Longimicrobium sp.]